MEVHSSRNGHFRTAFTSPKKRNIKADIPVPLKQSYMQHRSTVLFLNLLFRGFLLWWGMVE
ncbi:hypothetical protein BCN_C1_64 (plasmid) [Bacillus cereus NC7401]|nr:hypothetical protein BCN_C1_64 [Bacillus cereus NC7401]